MKEMIKLAVFLVMMSIIAAAALSGTYIFTLPMITAHKQDALMQSLTSGCMIGVERIETLGSADGTYYKGIDSKGASCGFAFRVSPKGYGGPIDMVVGIGTDGKVTSVKVLNMTETPGLGMQAKEQKFLGQFTGKSSRDQLKAKKDIDAITGATITSQAVADGVKQALSLYAKLKK